MLSLCKAILFGPLDNVENEKLKDLTPREFAYLVPLALLAIIMGVYPNAFMKPIRPSIEHLARHYQSYKLETVEKSFVKSASVLVDFAGRENHCAVGINKELQRFTMEPWTKKNANAGDCQ